MSHLHDNPDLAHHFDTPEQQFESGKLGMWLFLVTELLMFGGLFVLYAYLRANHIDIFTYASHYLDWKLGALNTAILLASSWTMALAVRAASKGAQKQLFWLLVITFFGGIGFFTVKSIEYSKKFSHGIFPGKSSIFFPVDVKNHSLVDIKGYDAKGDYVVLNQMYTGYKIDFDPTSFDGFGYTRSLGDHNGAVVVDGKAFKAVPNGEPDTVSVVNEAYWQAHYNMTSATLQQLLIANLETMHHNEVLGIHSAEDAANAGHGHGHATHDDAYTHSDVALAPALPIAGHNTNQCAISTSPALPAQNLSDLGVGEDEELARLGVPNVLTDHKVVHFSELPASAQKRVFQFFQVYYVMTGLHGLHVGIGMAVILWLIILTAKKRFHAKYYDPVDVGGLYWHLVDLVWIFLFPLLYLIH